MSIVKINSLGITYPVSFSAGTVSLPSITTSGDTNTGIFFSTADTIDFAEGGVATGQFDSSGNFKFNSGFGSVGTAYGCRAWIKFNGTGTPAINGSGNVTSITDIGTGQYTVNFTNAMPDTNYSLQASADDATGAGICLVSPYATASQQTTTSSRIRVWSTGFALVDSLMICISFFR